MKSRGYLLKLKKPRLFIRRVRGKSMLPAIGPGQLVYAVNKRPKAGDVVIAMHLGREVIKRVTRISKEGLYLVGDNAEHSTDSRDYGTFAPEDILAVVVWPRKVRKDG